MQKKMGNTTLLLPYNCFLETISNVMFAFVWLVFEQQFFVARKMYSSFLDKITKTFKKVSKDE